MKLFRRCWGCGSKGEGDEKLLLKDDPNMVLKIIFQKKKGLQGYHKKLVKMKWLNQFDGFFFVDVQSVRPVVVYY